MIAIFDAEYVLYVSVSCSPHQFERTDSGGGTVDFQEFVGGLSAFSSRGGRDEKLQCEYPIRDQQLP